MGRGPLLSHARTCMIFRISCFQETTDCSLTASVCTINEIKLLAICNFYAVSSKVATCLTFIDVIMFPQPPIIVNVIVFLKCSYYRYYVFESQPAGQSALSAHSREK